MRKKELFGLCGKLFGLCGILLLIVFCIYLLISISDTSSADFYDNTSIESKVNVSNVAPTVSQVVLHDTDGEDVSIGLDEGTTKTFTCNATVSDLNGWSDITAVNATIYDADTYNSSSANDNNYHYFTAGCTNSSINSTSIAVSCNFSVWYYANNASWNCNVSAIDSENASNTSVDATPPTITMLAALNLTTNVIDFGEMAPGATTENDEEQNVNVTNTGNADINLSVDGFGAQDTDGLAMNCTVGNISVDLLRYNMTASQNFDNSMWNLTDDKLTSGIPGYDIPQRVDDGDTAMLNSTNTTYWKLRVPIGAAAGTCNGTVTFSAVV